MLKLSPASHLASPADTATYGEYPSAPGLDVPPGFRGRITDEGPFTARPFRYHVYGGRFCPGSHRIAIIRELAGLPDIVTMSYVDGARDGRGWAFRERNGPDPVNGFTLLREAYEASEEGFAGQVRVPALWDRLSCRVVSDDARAIGIDLATRFAHLGRPVVETYPAAARDRIEDVDRRLGATVRRGVAVRASAAERTALLEAFELLDARLARSRFLLGRVLTDADIRLWVTLVRYDAGPNAARTINPGLHVYPHLWAYARDLYALPAFRRTTDFAAFTAPDARLPDWNAPTDRAFTPA
ncbi:putative glutathione S-transferase [Krasilnikovia cinnamomea]|uniref:Putative glutathione S-transferase n=1 Tax=Krasilnikovia cinnamomea TaxID=349313 RepID=A0A4Q7ZTU3_9ACTN|nr:glutathione S-transferase C-terminal domain-containing protein [Krasilnikovia cinnamomea]RZU54364.1 putative glutathione S-transferase [Krasilnikovia cinnamomea]